MYGPDKSFSAATPTGVKSGGELPGSFALKQNYPNPFNPSTLIAFDLPEASHVTLRVYNILGMEVKTLIDGMEKPGSVNVRFNSDGLSSGIYFYKLSAGSFREVRKMVLMK
jgi:hypothetical protein